MLARLVVALGTTASAWHPPFVKQAIAAARIPSRRSMSSTPTPFSAVSSSGSAVPLHQAKCETCSGSMPALGSDEVAELLRSLPGWYLSPQPQTLKAATQTNPDALKRSYKFSDWNTAQAFANSLGQVSEEEGHHPAIMIEWGRVSVWWWSHSIKGLHKNDFIMASKTDALADRAEGYKPFKPKAT